MSGAHDTQVGVQFETVSLSQPHHCGVDVPDGNLGKQRVSRSLVTFNIVDLLLIHYWFLLRDLSPQSRNETVEGEQNESVVTYATFWDVPLVWLSNYGGGRTRDNGPV